MIYIFLYLVFLPTLSTQKQNIKHEKSVGTLLITVTGFWTNLDWEISKAHAK